MPVLFERKITKIGTSLGITIPTDILKSYNLKAGDSIFIVSDALDSDDFILVDLRHKNKDDVLKMFD